MDENISPVDKSTFIQATPCFCSGLTEVSAADKILETLRSSIHHIYYINLHIILHA